MKFLVRNDSWRVYADEPRILQQVYLSRDQNSIRVRLIDGRSALLAVPLKRPATAFSMAAELGMRTSLAALTRG